MSWQFDEKRATVKKENFPVGLAVVTSRRLVPKAYLCGFLHPLALQQVHCST
jgi:hypothetical protein